MNTIHRPCLRRRASEASTRRRKGRVARLQGRQPRSTDNASHRPPGTLRRRSPGLPLAHCLRELAPSGPGVTCEAAAGARRINSSDVSATIEWEQGPSRVQFLTNENWLRLRRVRLSGWCAWLASCGPGSKLRNSGEKCRSAVGKGRALRLFPCFRRGPLAALTGSNQIRHCRPSTALTTWAMPSARRVMARSNLKKRPRGRTGQGDRRCGR